MPAAKRLGSTLAILDESEACLSGYHGWFLAISSGIPDE